MSVTAAARGVAPPQTAPVLDVRGMTRRFGGLVAVNNVSFAVRSGEIFGLIGPNGAGKTTLFNLMTGLTAPSAGSLVYQGTNITGAKPYQIARQGIARTFQNIRLFGNLSAIENVMIAQHVHTKAGVWAGIFGLPPAPREQRRTYEKAMALLALTGLADRAEEHAANFAYGNRPRPRAGTARAAARRTGGGHERE